ncbi:MAG: hypothetical protein CL388_07525 [Acidiferrobacteraceae bacterium]|jgi:hypothetical protein|nr:hypothetical protein [Acidiferrobacteraceae bacterium]MDP6434129.1 hypothetical protein [Arenicellales bacterium]MDP6671690.1 hypothetical protein [Arenicellales bacterium]MDP6725020.1 hypothetical protein [Arenicellales bacterium]|tara:strand:+ start:24179 stop:24517 length:339 start_codon:yes stop_codon:yes gene_type:complete
MKTSGHLLCFLGSILLTFLGQGISLAEDEEEKKVTVYSLQQEGWKIIESDTHEEVLLGLPPYELLRRVISLTTYWLQRDKEEIVCQIRYDSQLDRLQEKCGDRHPIPENGDA